MSAYPFDRTFTGEEFFRKVKKTLSTPVAASILQNRLFSFVIVITACIQTGLVAAGLHGWTCPFRSLLGVPCPGCGLSTALAHLIQGDWRGVLHTHAFAPVVFLGFIIMTGVCLLPNRYYVSAVHIIEKFERASGFMPILLTVMLIYWGVRLLNGI